MKRIICFIILLFLVHTGKSQTVISGMPTTVGGINSLIRIGNTIYIGGDFTQVNGNARQHLARFDANTGVLDSWSPTVNNDVTM